MPHNVRNSTPNPFPWRRFADVHMGEHLLGEDTISHHALGFCGETVPVFCPLCHELLGNIPVELVREEFADITVNYITPVLEWHQAKHHPQVVFSICESLIQGLPPIN